MAIDKPAIGSSDWGLKVNAALDQLDLKETIDGSATKASQAYESATEYTDARLGEAVFVANGDIAAVKSSAAAAATSASTAATSASSAQASAAAALAGVNGKADQSALDALAASPAALLAKNDRALRNIRVALASAGTTPCDILVGPTDSIGDGLGATSINKRWVSVLRDRLRAGFQPSGTVGGIGYVDLWNQGAYADHPVVVTNPVPNTSYGLGRQALDFTTVTQTATITAAMTDLDIIYRGTTGPTGAGNAQMLYTVDGDGGHIVETGGKVANGEYAEHITGLTAGSHTIVIYGNYVGGAQSPFTVEGVHIFNGDKTKGVRVWEGGQSGYRAADYVASAGWASAVKLVDPDVIVLPIGSNDYVIGRTPAQFKADLLTIIAAERAQCTGTPSIVLVPYWVRSQSSAVAPWSDFVAKYQEVAAADANIAVCDLGPLMGTDIGTLRGGLMSADFEHPSDAGHKFIGNRVADFITRSAL